MSGVQRCEPVLSPPLPVLSPPHQSYDTDEPTRPLALPDLADIFATFNKSKKQGFEHDSAILDDPNVAEFGQTLGHLILQQSDGTVFKAVPNIVKKPVKARTDTKAPRERKVRVSKPEVAKEPKVKALKKKAITITGRAVSEFQAIRSIPTPERCTNEQPITNFLTPKASVLHNTNHRTKRSKIKTNLVQRKLKTEFSKVPLMPPKQFAILLRAQKILYKKSSLESEPSPLPLRPSALHSLSKGLWSASNRCPEGHLTDGGPERFWPNQEKEEDPWELSQQEARQPRRISFEQVESLSFDLDSDHQYVLPMANEEVFDSELEEELQCFGTQESLQQLIETRDADSSDGVADFPIEPVIPSLHHLESSTTLLAALESEHISIQDDDASSLERSISRLKRQCSEESLGTRNVVHKCFSHDSPGSKVEIISIDDSTRAHQDVLSESADAAESECFDTRQIIDLESTDQEDAVDIDRAPPLHPAGREPSLCSVASTDLDPTVTNGASSLCMAPGRGIHWIIPDSEDDSDDHFDDLPLAYLGRNHQSQSGILNARPAALAPKKPDFHNYTTIQLQSELSKYGFKISKNRSGMAGLLSKCWEAKNNINTLTQQRTYSSSRTAAHESEAIDTSQQGSAVVPTSLSSTIIKSTATSIKKLTAEQKKAQKLAEQEVKKAKKLAEKEAKEARKVADKEALKAKKIADKEANEIAKVEATQQLFRDLTQLLRSESGKSWWTRILSYEPIVLEDFVDWIKVDHGISAEVDTVRDYMDTQGVCCVKKVTRTGKDRKRF